MSALVPVFESFSADYTARSHYAQRGDGQWFTRTQSRSLFGYRWGAWREISAAGVPDRRIPTSRRARLP